MTQQTQAQAALARELARIRRPRKQPQVQPVHLAEALQYHSRIAAIVELLEPASPADQTTEE